MQTKMKMETKTMTIMALFIAMSVCLSYVKIMGSIALDQVPVFLIFLLYKDKKAAFVSAIAHMITASLSGFPFSIGCHILIAIGMFIMFYVAVPIMKYTNKYIALAFVGIVNSFVLTFIVFIVIPFSWQTYWAIVSMLCVASVINIVSSLLLEKPLSRILKISEISKS